MTDRNAQSAADRLQRVLYTASGIGALVFGALLTSGPSGIMAQRDSLAPWFWWTTVVIAIVLPASLVVVARVAPLPVSRSLARVSVVGFVTVQAVWVSAMVVATLPPGTTPWLQGINALPSTLAGATWRSRWVWAFPVLQGAMVTGVQLLSTDRSGVDAALDGVGALFFCSVLTGVARAVIGAGDSQDLAGERARRAAMLAAASTTHERERARINAIVHDDIMSVLLAATRPGTGDISGQAQRAIEAVRGIAAPVEHEDEELSSTHVEAVLRATLADSGADQLVAELTDDGPVPAVAVAAASEAMGEALANAARHAGEHTHVSVSARIGHDLLEVRVTDDGAGFDTADVSPTRLGIRLSIVGRMATIPGGRGTVSSTRGHGTTVAIEWSRP